MEGKETYTRSGNFYTEAGLECQPSFEGLLREFLKETKDLHILLTVGRAFHILVAQE